MLKKYLKDSNKSDILPDFWNIMLEIHKDDPKGYDILVRSLKNTCFLVIFFNLIPF